MGNSRYDKFSQGEIAAILNKPPSPLSVAKQHKERLSIDGSLISGHEYQRCSNKSSSCPTCPTIQNRLARTRVRKASIHRSDLPGDSGCLHVRVNVASKKTNPCDGRQYTSMSTDPVQIHPNSPRLAPLNKSAQLSRRSVLPAPRHFRRPRCQSQPWRNVDRQMRTF